MKATQKQKTNIKTALIRDEDDENDGKEEGKINTNVRQENDDETDETKD
jgi:hypothetical protein